MKTETLEMVLAEGGTLVDPEKEAAPFVWEDDGTGDIPPAFPIVKIVQGVSKMPGAEKHGGEFWRSDTEAYYPEMVIVPLFQKETRALFNRQHDQTLMVSDEEPDALLCASADGHVPLPDMPLWAHRGEMAPQACGDCPLSQWGEDEATGRPIKPPCSNSWLVLADHDGDLVQFRVSGASIKPWKTFIARRVRPGNRRLCQYRVTLTTERKTQGNNIWQELVVTAEQMTPEEASTYNAVLVYERERFKASINDTTLAAE